MTADLTPILISLDIEADLAYAGIRSVSLPERLGEGFGHWAAITADHPSDAGWSSQEMAQARWDAAMDTLAERWTRAARAAGAHLGYDVTVVECQPQRQTITLCDDGTTVENAIWQCAHDATAVA